MVVLPGLHKNIFSMTQTLKKGLQVMSEGKTLIKKKTPARFILKKRQKTAAKELF